MFDFPSAPSNGQQVTAPNGAVYAWNGTSWAPVSIGLPAYAPLASPVFTGDARAVTPAYGDNDTSIPTTAFVQSAVAPVANNTGRNLVMNGAFAVQQRGAGAFTVSGAYLADRWQQWFVGGSVSTSINPASDAFRAQVGDENFSSLLYSTFTGTAGAGDLAIVQQNIESVRRTAGKSVTLSFWAAGAGLKLGANIEQNFGTGGSPSASVTGTGQSVSLTGTFARYNMTFAVAGVAGKTLGTNGNDTTVLNLWLSSGSTNAVRAGSVGVQSGSIALWGVQLEIGSVATPFDAGGTPQQQLAACQRFYQTGTVSWFGYIANGTAGYNKTLICPMRANPTIAGLSGCSASQINGQEFLATVVTGGTGNLSFNSTYTASADL